MNIGINDIAELCIKNDAASRTAVSDDSFRQAIEDAVCGKNSELDPIYHNQNSYVVISPKFEEQLQNDPELALEIARKIESMTGAMCRRQKENTIIIDRRGELTQYSPKSYDKKAREREYEEAKEVEKARLRRKARIDAYFKIVRQISMKRKLVEQENIKRPRNKRYRSDIVKLDSIVKSILQQPNNTLPYYF